MDRNRAAGRRPRPDHAARTLADLIRLTDGPVSLPIWIHRFEGIRLTLPKEAVVVSRSV
jgi:hypothetical protein